MQCTFKSVEFSYKTFNSLTLQRHWTPLNCAIHLAQQNNCKSNKQCARTIVVFIRRNDAAA